MLAKVAVGTGGACAWGSAVAGGLSWAASVSEVTVELLGVGLPVVLASTAGSLLARSYVDADVPYPRAIAATLAWIVFGCFSAPAAMVVAERFGYALPTSAQAFLALLISSIGPRLYPVVVDGVTDWVKDWIAKRKGAKDAPPAK